MHIANKLAILAGSAFFVVGLSLFINPYVSTVMSDLVNNQGLLWVTGLITFVMGTVMLALYNTWSKSWRVLVTIIGWLAVIKGAVLMLFPQVMTLYVNFLSKCPSEDFLSPLNHLDSMEPILIRGRGFLCGRTRTGRSTIAIT